MELCVCAHVHTLMQVCLRRCSWTCACIYAVARALCWVSSSVSFYPLKVFTLIFCMLCTHTHWWAISLALYLTRDESSHWNSSDLLEWLPACSRHLSPYPFMFVPAPLLRTHMCASEPGLFCFLLVLGIQTQVLARAQSALYELNQLLSPTLDLIFDSYFH